MTSQIISQKDYEVHLATKRSQRHPASLPLYLLCNRFLSNNTEENQNLTCEPPMRPSPSMLAFGNIFAMCLLLPPKPHPTSSMRVNVPTSLKLSISSTKSYLACNTNRMPSGFRSTLFCTQWTSKFAFYVFFEAEEILIGDDCVQNSSLRLRVVKMRLRLASSCASEMDLLYVGWNWCVSYMQELLLHSLHTTC